MDCMFRFVTTFALLGTVAACGGGGGGSKAPSPPPPAPAPTATLTAQTGSMPLQLAWLDETSLTITGSVSWTNLPAGIHVVATDVGNYLGLTKSVQVTTAGSYSLTMAGNSELAPGNYSGSVTVQACQDSACAKPFANTAVTLPYSLVVSPVDEWSTYQRTPGHNAYVPITLNPSRFALKWKWNTTEATGAPLFEQGPNQPAVTDGTAVYTTSGSTRAEGYIYAVNKTTGRSLWSRSLGASWMTNPPAVRDGIVYVATSGLFFNGVEYTWSNSFLWAFRAADGTPVFKEPYPTRWSWPHFFAPTVKDGTVYLNGGDQVLETFAFDATTGIRKWQRSVGEQYVGSTTPMVDGSVVFNVAGLQMKLLQAESGLPVSTLPMASGMEASQTYGAAAVATGRGSVLALSGSTSLFTVNSPELNYGAKRALNRFASAPLATSWSTPALYDGVPVAADGVIYAYRYDPNQLDALDEATGQVLWSWPLPASEGSFFRDNMIVTRNILFFNTNTGLKAFDLKTRSIVWRLTLDNCNGWDACYGNISMSADRILFMTRGWNILAVSLR